MAKTKPIILSCLIIASSYVYTTTAYAKTKDECMSSCACYVVYINNGSSEKWNLQNVSLSRGQMVGEISGWTEAPYIKPGETAEIVMEQGPFYGPQFTAQLFSFDQTKSVNIKGRQGWCGLAAKPVSASSDDLEFIREPENSNGKYSVRPGMSKFTITE